jgi:hypothetical protein
MRFRLNVNYLWSLAAGQFEISEWIAFPASSEPETQTDPLPDIRYQPKA